MKADEKFIQNFLKELRKEADDPEAMTRKFDTVLERKINPTVGPTKKANITDNIVHQLLGEAALQEVEGLDTLPYKQSVEKAFEKSNKGLGKLAKAVNVSPNISVEDLTSQKAYGIQHPNFGVKLDSKFETPELSLKQLGLGVAFHEGGHTFDDVARRVSLAEDEMLKRSSPVYKQAMAKKLKDKSYKPTALEMMSNDEFNRYYSQIKDPYLQYIKQNPEKLEKTIMDAGISKFESEPVPDMLSPEYKDLKPSQLQEMYSGTGHWFKRNFPFENLKNVLKGGIKTIKGIGIGAIPATAAALAAAYSPNTKAATVAKTTGKVLEEGDPTSLIFPPEAGEGEEEEIKKMYEEAKFKKLKERLK